MIVIETVTYIVFALFSFLLFCLFVGFTHRFYRNVRPKEIKKQPRSSDLRKALGAIAYMNRLP